MQSLSHIAVSYTHLVMCLQFIQIRIIGQITSKMLRLTTVAYTHLLHQKNNIPAHKCFQKVLRHTFPLPNHDFRYNKRQDSPYSVSDTHLYDVLRQQRFERQKALGLITPEMVLPVFQKEFPDGKRPAWTELTPQQQEKRCV